MYFLSTIWANDQTTFVDMNPICNFAKISKIWFKIKNVFCVCFQMEMMIRLSLLFKYKKEPWILNIILTLLLQLKSWLQKMRVFAYIFCTQNLSFIFVKDYLLKWQNETLWCSIKSNMNDIKLHLIKLIEIISPMSFV